MSPQPERSNWRHRLRPLRHGFAVRFYRFLTRFLALLPRRLALGLGEQLGLATPWIARGLRSLTLRNLREVYAVGPEQAAAMMRRVFRWTGRNAVDVTCRMTQPLTVMRWIDIEPRGLTELREDNARGGILLLVPHLGAFELIGTALDRHGFDVCAPTTPSRNPGIERILHERRLASGIRALPRKGSMVALVKHLADRGVVAIMMDQDTKVSSIDAGFLGHAARTPVGPAVIVQRTGVAVSCASIYLDEQDRHQIQFDRIRSAGASDASIEELTQMFNDALGDHIERAPAQWVWFHRRWRFGAEGGGVPLAGLLGMLGFSLLLLLSACQGVEEEAAPPPPAPGPDQTLADFTLLESSHGEARWSLRADLARVFRGRHTELEGVFLVFLSAAAETTTTVRADAGRYVDPDAPLVALGNVRVIDSDGTEIYTDSLLWDPRSERISTDAAVEIRQQGDVIRGVGFEADPDLNDIVLKQNVSADLQDLPSD